MISISLKKIGDGVEHATKFAGKTAGELASGTWDVAAGIIKRIYTAAVGVIAVGIVDAVDGSDLAYADANTAEVEGASETGIHHVEPHNVEGYFREDGTYVEGYYRDGADGEGYLRSNPDGDPNNNIN